MGESFWGWDGVWTPVLLQSTEHKQVVLGLCRLEPPVLLPNLPTTQAMLLWLHWGLILAGYHQTAQREQLLFHKADARQDL